MACSPKLPLTLSSETQFGISWFSYSPYNRSELSIYPTTFTHQVKRFFPDGQVRLMLLLPAFRSTTICRNRYFGTISHCQILEKSNGLSKCSQSIWPDSIIHLFDSFIYSTNVCEARHSLRI